MTREERAYNYAANKKATKFTVCEIAKHYNDGYSDGYKDAVDKAYEWLNANYAEIYLLARAGVSSDKVVEQFKKYMEESK